MTPEFPAPEAPQRGWIGPYRLASLGWRVLAFLIDIIVPVAVVIVFASFDRKTHTSTVSCPQAGPNGVCVRTVTTGGLAWVGEILVLLWVLANNVFLQGKTGQSIGKRVLGLQLARPVYLDGRGNTFVLPGAGRCFVRQILHILDGIPLLAGYWLAPLVSARRQTFADMIMGTVVLGPRAANGSLYPLDSGDGIRA